MRERVVRAVAGFLITASVLLAVFVNDNWLILTAFVGLNLLQSSFTKFCPLEIILKKSGVEK
ncbi:YgaP family membrane protein [Sunxiuqinia sp. sy24]|uniref:YgaP family membrane protein n=1 Tax=Sunxiuqinia sp. sy24 TaxID=3461495 RepID=UPI00404558B1